MKKYLNKGLLYMWFNAAKVPIMLGLILWGFIANSMLRSQLWRVRNDIAYSGVDYFQSMDFSNYIFLGFIFLGIYFIAGGINKRNTTMFLSSGPYTKKQIKYNELIGLLLTLVLFVIEYIYIAITFYIRNAQLLSIVNGYTNIIAIEIVRVILFGIIGITFMLIVDTLFSNSVISVLAMTLVIPESIMLIIGDLYSALRYFGVGNGESLANKINTFIYGSRENVYIPNPLLDSIGMNQITTKRLNLSILSTIIVVLVMLVLFNIAQKKYKLEGGNKIFSSKKNENIMVMLSSIAVGILAQLLILDGYVSRLVYRTGEFLPLVGGELIKVMCLWIIVICVFGFIAYKIIKKVIKTVA